jgi:hypothetical protein
MLQRLVRLEQLSAIGSSSRDERLRRATLLLLSLTTSLAGAIWGFAYWQASPSGPGICRTEAPAARPGRALEALGLWVEAHHPAGRPCRAADLGGGAAYEKNVWMRLGSMSRTWAISP